MGKSNRFDPDGPSKRDRKGYKKQRLAVANSLRSIEDVLDDEDLDEWFDKLADDELHETLEPIRKTRR